MKAQKALNKVRPGRSERRWRRADRLAEDRKWAETQGHTVGLAARLKREKLALLEKQLARKRKAKARKKIEELKEEFRKDLFKLKTEKLWERRGKPSPAVLRMQKKVDAQKLKLQVNPNNQ